MKKLWVIIFISFIFIFLTACGTTQMTPKKTDGNQTANGRGNNMDMGNMDMSNGNKGDDSYQKYATQIDAVEKNISKYKDIQTAINDGYLPASPYVPEMGYHFANGKVDGTDQTKPNILMYVLDENKNFKLVGAVWSVSGDKPKTQLFQGIDWGQKSPAGAHYEDGTFIPVDNSASAPQTNPQTKSKFVKWTPAEWDVHMFTDVKNPNGLFADMNPALDKYNAYAKDYTNTPIEKYLSNAKTAK